MNPRIALFFAASIAAAAEIPSADWQIKTALLAAPKADRDGATVLGFDPNGAMVTLRKGSNNFICLATYAPIWESRTRSTGLRTLFKTSSKFL
jgi:hypothetical protein